MAYSYGVSPVAGLPTPLDGTPLDATSWSALIDAVGVRAIQTVSSQLEQDAYMTAVTNAGLGPSVAQPVTVRRSDLNGLVMTNSGLGWRREFGGALDRFAWTEATGVKVGGWEGRIANVTVNIPVEAYVSIWVNTTFKPTEPGFAWQMRVTDGAGTHLTTPRRWSHTQDTQWYSADMTRTVLLPAGSTSVGLWVGMESMSKPVYFDNSAIAVSYA